MTQAPLTAEEITRDLEFEIGQQFVRKDLHEVCGGNHQPGISPIRDLSAIFLFASTTTSEHGYEDEWLPNDHFVITGVGRVGDQSWKGNNSALASHHADGRRLFLLERLPNEKPTVVTYLGEFEYVTHWEETIKDGDADPRRVFKFELKPVSGESIQLPEPADTLDLATLYRLSREASRSGSTESTRASTPSEGGVSQLRSKVVKQFALRLANGVCQGFNEPAPFTDKSGDKYLEVHHLRRLSDDGPDHPDNVIALCPNCHAKVHYGQDGDEFNQTLYERNLAQLSEL